MDIVFLISTALSVSADSFLCGLSLCVPQKDKNKALFAIAISVLALCFIGAFLGVNLGKILSKYANLLGGSVLLLIALREVFERENKGFLNYLDNNFSHYFLAGFAVGIDGLVGSFTLSITGFNPLLVVLIITFLHVILLYLSISVSSSFLQKYAPIKQVAPAFIFLLGLYKVLC